MKREAYSVDWQIIITQSGSRGELLTRRVRELGVNASHVPLIETRPFAQTDIARQLATIQNDVDGWIFTSTTAARAFIQFYDSQSNWKFGTPVCYCIGETTASVCLERGFLVRWSPHVRDASDLVDHINQTTGGSETFVFVRGVQARSTVYDRLSGLGYEVSQVMVYKTSEIEQIDLEVHRLMPPVLWVLFSPTGVRALVHLVSDIFDLVEANRHFLLPFGRTTKQAIDHAGLRSVSVPPATTHDAVLHRIEHFLQADHSEDD